MWAVWPESDIHAVWSEPLLGTLWIAKDAKFLDADNEDSDQGPVVQSIVSLKSSLVVKMLTVLVSTISNSQVFLLKNVSSFCKCKSYSHFFSKNISVYAIFDDQRFNNILTNDIVCFEQLGPDVAAAQTDWNLRWMYTSEGRGSPVLAPIH